jgi:hypothetical protein
MLLAGPGYLEVLAACEPDGWGVLQDSVRPFHDQRDIVGIPIQLQTLTVHEPVMKSAQCSEVGDFVRAAVVAVFDVVHISPAGVTATSWKSAARIAGHHCSPIPNGN